MKRLLIVTGIGVLILVGIILAGCGAEGNYSTSEVETIGESSVEILSRYTVEGQQIVVFYDSARDVTCWFSPYFRQGGISCLAGKR